VNYTYFPNVFFAVFGFGVHLLRIQIYNCKANYTTNITKQRVRNFVSFCSVKNAPYRKMFQIKVVDPNEICTLCHITFV
jgi:hypothetical protein